MATTTDTQLQDLLAAYDGRVVVDGTALSARDPYPPQDVEGD